MNKPFDISIPTLQNRGSLWTDNSASVAKTVLYMWFWNKEKVRFAIHLWLCYILWKGVSAMLLCCSIIPTNGKFTNKVFVKLISEWVLARHRSEFGTLSWNGESDLFCAGKKGGCFQVELFDEGRKCGIHFVSPGKYKKQRLFQCALNSGTGNTKN